MPELFRVEDEHDEAESVVHKVLEHYENGLSLDRMAVLVRASQHANLLEVALAEANIPYRKVGGVRFTESSHIKDLFALLRVTANPTGPAGVAARAPLA